MALILRTIKGSPLTYQEMDNNLTYLSSSISQSVSASYALTASYALNAGGGSGVGFPFTGSAQITGSLIVTGSTTVAGNITVTGSAMPDGYNFIYASGDNANSKTLTTIDGFRKNSTRPLIESTTRLGGLDLSVIGGSGTGYDRGLVLPTSQPPNPANGSIYWDSTTQTLYIYDGPNTTWVAK
jgi:hypothetical protein